MSLESCLSAMPSQSAASRSRRQEVQLYFLHATNLCSEKAFCAANARFKARVRRLTRIDSDVANCFCLWIGFERSSRQRFVCHEIEFKMTRVKFCCGLKSPIEPLQN